MKNLLKSLPTPSHIILESLIEKNLKILKDVEEKSGAEIVFALKGFAMRGTGEIIKKYINSCAASGLYEAKFAYGEYSKNIHTFSPAFSEEEFLKISKLSTHLIFNSAGQWEKFRHLTQGKTCGLRVNPMTSFSINPTYNPCLNNSRLGLIKEEITDDLLKGISGLHFHALCEQGAEELEKVLINFEKYFGKWISKIQWLNFGGGHKITRPDYNLKLLIKIIKNFYKKYPNLEKIYLEPSDSIIWQAGFTLSKILDLIPRKPHKIAIIDFSFRNHGPDFFEVPYNPEIRESIEKGFYSYLFGGPTCLAGDIIDKPYCFSQELKIGDTIIIEDMARYTFVKDTSFNGIKIPNLFLLKKNGKIETIHKSTYADYKNRLS